ncbi:MAG TPA: acetate--CoA ligase family protein [Candidatus Sulfomarinibacteraceae bacterium]|nr:acetate--CoA ligase family protein [Candidatus Sulfomarinibacteraceae bacterium]
MASTLTPFFEPQGVVLVGASQDPTKLGFGLARNLVQSDYRGAIHFVNPHGGTLLERPVYEAVGQVPDPVDLAVILIPAPAVPAAVAECGERDIRAAIISSGGFRETGPEGAALEEKVVQAARRHGMRLIGPNCIGLLDTHLPLDTTFLPPPGPSAGNVAFISHSGAICAAVIDWARGQGFGLSRLVSLGNQADVDETDVLAPVAADPYTRVITMYMEGVRDGRRFVEEAARVSRQKPLLALKVGRFPSGRCAVASHTGAMAGEESAFNAAFRRAGVIRAETSEELFDWARALAWCPPPGGRNVAILTNAGGPAVAAADALESHGMHVVPLGEETRARLREGLPPAASVHNPVDMLASASPQQYAACLRHLLADPEVHSVLVILPPPPMHTTAGVARAMIPLIYATTKPVVVAVMGERLIQEAVEQFRAAHVPEYRFPERAASALAILAQRAEYLAREEQVPVCPDDVSPQRAATALAGVAAGPLNPETTAALMDAYGIATPATALAHSAGEAAARAQEMGFPVALKVASPEIIHKSDIGGIALDLSSPETVGAAYSRLVARAREARPEATILGAHVQQMAPAGQEVIAGVVQDPQFGPVVMFGAGGVEVEALQDVAFALAPLTEAEAEELLASTWAGRRLDGYRHIAPADRRAVLDVLYRLGQLALDFPRLAEMEINPLVVLPRGALAVDVRIVAGEG